MQCHRHCKDIDIYCNVITGLEYVIINMRDAFLDCLEIFRKGRAQQVESDYYNLSRKLHLAHLQDFNVFDAVNLAGSTAQDGSLSVMHRNSEQPNKCGSTSIEFRCILEALVSVISWLQEEENVLLGEKFADKSKRTGYKPILFSDGNYIWSWWEQKK